MTSESRLNDERQTTWHVEIFSRAITELFRRKSWKADKGYYPDAIIAGVLNNLARKALTGESFIIGNAGNIRRQMQIPYYEQPATFPAAGLLNVAAAAGRLGAPPPPFCAGLMMVLLQSCGQCQDAPYYY
jgi:hypothetical protein